MEIVKINDKNRELFEPVLMEPDYEPGSSPESLGVLEDGRAAGAAVYIRGDGELILSSIYIVPQYRGQGFGGSLLDAVIDVGREAGAWFLNASFFLSQDDIASFLFSRGFVITGFHGLYAVQAGSLLNSEYVRKRLFEREYPGICKSVGQLNRKELYSALKLFSREGYPVSRIKRKEFLPQLSFCVFDIQGNELGGILCFSSGEDMTVDYLLIHGKGRPELLLMFRHFISALKSEGYENSLCFFHAENEVVSSIVEKLSGAPAEEMDRMMNASLELFSD
ncbi:MAG: GNAT family N-acetyltransferase [Lachnospiraceae bacterium]|nr:GNAT family N-acetyltransferase [Lachnospiraceae bacterium]